MLHKFWNLHELQDPAIANYDAPGVYPPLDNGNAMDIWVKDSNGQPIQGEVRATTCGITWLRNIGLGFVDRFGPVKYSSPITQIQIVKIGGEWNAWTSKRFQTMMVYGL